MTTLSPFAVLLVALGGAAGSVLRYLIGVWLPPLSAGLAAGIPVGTLVVNLLGAFLIGLVFGWLPPTASGDQAQAWVRLAVASGFCGGFTTFSALSAETLGLVTTGRTGRAATYLMLTLVLGLVATWLGMRVAASFGGRPPRILSLS